MTIEECDIDGTLDPNAVEAGDPAYFLVSVGDSNMPHEGTVTVFYNTANGPSIDGSEVAVADTDYIPKLGQALTFSYDSSANDDAGGYDPQIIQVDTVPTSNGGTFSVVIPCYIDPFAATPGTEKSVYCTIDPSVAIQMNSPKSVGNIVAAVKPVTVVVGQQISLTAIVTTAPGDTLTNEFWTIQGSQ